MYAVYGGATERGIKERNAAKYRERRAARLLVQRNNYEAALEAQQHIAQIKRMQAERAEAMAAEMRARGYQFRHTYREIERRACRLFKVKPSDLRSHRRTRDIAFVRHFVMYWSARLTPLSYPQLGRLMGGKDHTTILHGARVYPQKRAKMGRFVSILGGRAALDKGRGE